MVEVEDTGKEGLAITMMDGKLPTDLSRVYGKGYKNNFGDREQRAGGNKQAHWCRYNYPGPPEFPVRHMAMSTLARGRTHHMRETLLSLSRIWCPSHTPHHIFDYLLNSCLSEFQELKSSKMTSSLPELPCPTSSRHSINIDWSNEWMAVTLERVVLYGMPGGWRREDGLQRTVQMVREESGERSANKSLKNCDWE